MEVPAVEDSMEMASPYQGQGDDFDIDIDIMDDQGSHMDSDMMGADEYPTSHPSLFPNDANNDADMVDEPSEGSMVDADDYVEEDHDIEVQDEDVTYEAEMQEGDQDVNVGAPEIPTIQVEAAADETAVNEPVPSLTEPVGSEGDGSADPAKPTPTELHPVESEDQAQGVTAEPRETETGRLDQALGADGDQADAVADNVELVEEKHEITESKEAGTEDALAHGEPTAKDLDAPQVESEAHEAKDEHAEHDSHNVHEAEDQDQHDGSLHPVKVLYQDNEISLFPPLEGDSAETFFLHDEDVAYDSVGKLFGSLREVLMDNVAENEVLVIDVDSLGIQITEDSSYTSKVTLHQILDIYLRLCHNDGTNEPEALYLTLSSKLAVNSELAALDAAANEGKGLSQVHTWDEFDDEIPADEKAANAQETSQPVEEAAFADETEPGQPVTESHQGAPEQEPLGGEFFGADDTEEALEEVAPEPSAGDHEAGAETEHVVEVQHEEKEVTQEYHETEEAPPAHEGDHFEDQYDSEAHHSESSATLANEHAEDGYAVGSTKENHGTDDQHAEDFDHEDFDQEQNEADEFDEPDALQDELAHEGILSEENAEDDTTARGNESFHEAEAQDEVENAPAANLTGDVDDASYDQSEPTLQNAPPKDATTEDRTPEPGLDNLGAAEDLVQTPAENHHNHQHEHTEGVDQEQYEEDEYANEGELGAPSAEQNGGDEFDDYYPPPDLEVTEAIELGGTDAPDTDPHPHDNLSTKRSREEDEEWDVAATTTPEIKRRRS